MDIVVPFLLLICYVLLRSIRNPRIQDASLAGDALT